MHLFNSVHSSHKYQSYQSCYILFAYINLGMGGRIGDGCMADDDVAFLRAEAGRRYASRAVSICDHINRMSIMNVSCCWMFRIDMFCWMYLIFWIFKMVHL